MLNSRPARCPTGPLDEKWTRFKFEAKLVNPANKRKYTVIVVGTGLAGGVGRRDAGRTRLQRPRASASRTRPRRAHSIAAQGGINAAKNYQNDGDSVYRLFYDTIKGGDFRSREANVHRLAEVLGQHHRPVRRPGRAVRPRVRRPARQPLASAAPRCRAPSTAAGRPASNSCSARTRRCAGRSAYGKVKMLPADARCSTSSSSTAGPAGIVVRDLVTGKIESFTGRRRGARDRRLRQRLLPLDQRHRLQRHGHLPGLQARGRVRQPVLHADPPDLHPGHRRPPVEADADERVAPQRRPRLGAEDAGRRRQAPDARSPRTTATTTWSGSTRASATSPRATSPAGRPRRRATRAAASARAAAASTSTSPTPSSGRARPRSGRSTATCSTCTSASPARTPTSGRCASTPPCTTRWAGCGWTTT